MPASLARLPLLTRLDLRDNQLRDVPPELLDAPFVRLQGNPLGRPPPDPLSPPGRVAVGLGADHSQGAGVITGLTAHLSFPRDTHGPRNAQAVADLRSGQVWREGGAGLEKPLSTHHTALTVHLARASGVSHRCLGRQIQT